MPVQVRRLLTRNILITGAVLLTALGVGTEMIAALTPGGLFAASGFAVLLIFVTIFVGILGVWLHSRTKRGAVLLDAGYTPQRKLYLFNAAITLLMATAYFLQDTAPSANVYFKALPLLFMTLAIYSALSAFTRLQLCEGGIWGYWNLLPWRKIANYTWLDESTLLVDTTGWPLFRSGALTVPPRDKAAFEAILEQYTG